MAKQRSVVSVHVDIAALVWATRGLKSKEEWAEWGSTFVEALATQNYEINEFSAKLMSEVVEYRKKEAERISEIRNKKDKDVQDVQVQSVQTGVQTVSKSDSKKVSKDLNINILKIPTVEEVHEYCTERGNSIDAGQFVDHYQARGWILSGGRKVKDWKACVRTWEKSYIAKQNENRRIL